MSKYYKIVLGERRREWIDSLAWVALLVKWIVPVVDPGGEALHLSKCRAFFRLGHVTGDDGVTIASIKLGAGPASISSLRQVYIRLVDTS